jgi:hypothetical protein
VAQVVECLPGKCEALSSSPYHQKKKGLDSKSQNKTMNEIVEENVEEKNENVTGNY